MTWAERVRPRTAARPTTGILVVSAAAAVAAAVVVSIGGPAVAVLLVGAVVALAAAIVAPGVMLGAYLLIAFYKGSINAYLPVDLTVLLALANAAQIAFVVGRPRRGRLAWGGIALWLSLGVLLLAGLLYAPNQALGLQRTVTYWALVIVAIAPAAIRVGSDPRYVRQLLWAFLAMGTLTVLLGLSGISDTTRLQVLGQNTIQVARAALLVPLLAITFVLPQGRPERSLLAFLLVPVAIVVAVASGSRGPLVAIALLGAIGVAWELLRAGAARWRRLGALLGAFIGSTLAVIVALPVLPSLSLGRFGNLAQFAEGNLASGDTSAQARVLLFDFAGRLFGQHPIIGTGTSGFEALSPFALGSAADSYPHNAFLQVMAEHGLIGLALFVAVVWVGLRRRLPADPSSLALRALFIFFLLNAMVSGDIFSDRETLGLLMLILAIEAPDPRSEGRPAAGPGGAGPSSRSAGAGRAPADSSAPASTRA